MKFLRNTELTAPESGKLTAYIRDRIRQTHLYYHIVMALGKVHRLLNSTSEGCCDHTSRDTNLEDKRLTLTGYDATATVKQEVGDFGTGKEYGVLCAGLRKLPVRKVPLMTHR